MPYIAQYFLSQRFSSFVLLVLQSFRAADCQRRLRRCVLAKFSAHLHGDEPGGRGSPAHRASATFLHCHPPPLARLLRRDVQGEKPPRRGGHRWGHGAAVVPRQWLQKCRQTSHLNDQYLDLRNYHRVKWNAFVRACNQEVTNLCYVDDSKQRDAGAGDASFEKWTALKLRTINYYELFTFVYSCMAPHSKPGGNQHCHLPIYQ